MLCEKPLHLSHGVRDDGAARCQVIPDLARKTASIYLDVPHRKGKNVGGAEVGGKLLERLCRNNDDLFIEFFEKPPVELVTRIVLRADKQKSCIRVFRLKDVEDIEKE